MLGWIIVCCNGVNVDMLSMCCVYGGSRLILVCIISDVVGCSVGFVIGMFSRIDIMLKVCGLVLSLGSMCVR